MVMPDGNAVGVMSNEYSFPRVLTMAWKLEMVAPVTLRSEVSKSPTVWLKSTVTGMTSAAVGLSTKKRGAGARSPPPSPQMDRISS